MPNKSEKKILSPIHANCYFINVFYILKETGWGWVIFLSLLIVICGNVEHPS